MRVVQNDPTVLANHKRFLISFRLIALRWDISVAPADGFNGVMGNPQFFTDACIRVILTTKARNDVFDSFGHMCPLLRFENFNLEKASPSRGWLLDENYNFPI